MLPATTAQGHDMNIQTTLHVTCMRAARRHALPRKSLAPPHAQKGATLIELMVGIAIGLLVVAVAMGALMVSRGVSGTVSDASAIQQQAAYAMRVIGQQTRQAGSLRLNLNPGTMVTSDLYLAPVAFEIKAGDLDLQFHLEGDRRQRQPGLR